jgi:hypothetical protein
MKRPFGLICLVALAFAQGARDAYRAAYQEWRQAEPALERDAGSGGDLNARATRASQAQLNFAKAHRAFLGAFASDEITKLAWLETPPDAPSAMISESAAATITAANRALKRNMDIFANDPDPGIRELRSMLAHESAAANALAAAMDKRKQTAEAVKNANGTVAESQVKAADLFHAVEAGDKQGVEEGDREGTAWTQYYSLLVSGSHAPAAPPAPAPTAPSSVVTTVVTPLPMIRYTGAWTFPPVGGLYHGPQPEFVDMVVREANGHADGTLFARFNLPAGSGDPVLRFNFSGDFRNTRNQVLKVLTSDGASGTIELIPGSAFNLLEVNFLIDAKPGKMRQGNMVLIKK